MAKTTIFKKEIRHRFFNPNRNVVPDRVDLRDRRYMPPVPVVPSLKLDPAKDIPVLDQGKTKACTGFSLSTVVYHLQRIGLMGSDLALCILRNERYFRWLTHSAYLWRLLFDNTAKIKSHAQFFRSLIHYAVISNSAGQQAPTPQLTKQINLKEESHAFRHNSAAHKEHRTGTQHQLCVRP